MPHRHTLQHKHAGGKPVTHSAQLPVRSQAGGGRTLYAGQLPTLVDLRLACSQTCRPYASPKQYSPSQHDEKGSATALLHLCVKVSDEQVLFFFACLGDTEVRMGFTVLNAVPTVELVASHVSLHRLHRAM